MNWKRSSVRSFCEAPLGQGGAYASIEIQQVEYKGVRGHSALLRRTTGELDIYFERHVPYDDEWVRNEPTASHQVIGELTPIDFDEITCVIEPTQVKVLADFATHDGRRIRFSAREALIKRAPIFTPAPIQTTPKTLRFLVLGNFALLSRRAELDLSVDGAAQPLATFLLPDAVAPFSSARIGSNIALGGLGYADPTNGDVTELTEDGKTLRLEGGDHWIEATFTPPIPDTLDARTAGRVKVTSSVGPVASGSWHAPGDGTFKLNNVSQDWFPGWTSPSRLALRTIRRHNRRSEVWQYHATETQKRWQPMWSNGREETL